MQETPETRAQALGLEDTQEEEIATLSSILAWRIPWTEEPSRLLLMVRGEAEELPPDPWPQAPPVPALPAPVSLSPAPSTPLMPRYISPPGFSNPLS